MKFFVYNIICLLWAASAWAQKFYIEVEPHSGSMEDSFRMSVVLEGYQPVQPPLLEGGDDFSLTLIGPSNQVTIVNGVVNSRVSYEYQLLPKKPGDLLSPSAEVEVKGQTLKASAVKIHVDKSSGATGPAGKDVFLQQSIDKKRVYVGEQILNKLELYAAVRLQAPQLLDLTYDDFYAQPIDDDAHFERNIDGKRYQVTGLSRALYPLRVGELTIPPRKIQARVLVRTKSRFPSMGGYDPFSDDFFGGFFDTAGFEDKVLTSNSVDVTVQEPPPLPQGQSTWGLSSPLIGKTALRASQDAGSVKVGESKLLTLEINSFGNLNGLKEVPLDLGDAAKIYQESPMDNKTVEGDKLLSRKTFKVSIVPMKAGTLTIPSFRLPYFDPETQIYKLVTTDPIEIKVEPNPAFSDSKIVPEVKVKQRTKPVESTTAPAPKTGPTYEEPSQLERLTDRVSLSTLTLVLASLCVFLGFLYAFLRVAKFSKQRSGPLRALQAARSMNELEKAFNNALEVRFGVDSEMLTKAAREECLRQNIKDSKLLFEILALLDTLQELRFGGKSLQGSEFEDLKYRLLQSAKKL